MVQFTAGSGRLKCGLLYVGFESKDPFHYTCKFPGAGGATATATATGGLKFTHSHSLRKRKLSYTLNASSSSSSMINSDGIWDEILEEESEDSESESEVEFHLDEFASFRGLVLDISYRPVNVVCWKRAICLEFLDKADVLEYYDQTVNSPSGSFYIPAVLRVPHLQIVKRRRVKKGLSRKNIFHRDDFTCQYCSSTENLTIDHVLPIAQGGKWTWENLVAACAKCNSKKGHKTVEEANMRLMKVPKAPKDYEIFAIPLTNHAIKMMQLRKEMPDEWRQYLPQPRAAP